MTSIYHIDQLPYSVAMKFCSNLGSTHYSASEKIDGANVSICLINGQIYIKTKKAEPTRDPKIFRNLAEKFETSLMNEFARFLDVVIKHEVKLVSIFNKYGIEQLFGELVPIPKPNIIRYNPVVIGPGALFIFDDTDEQIHYEISKAFCDDWRVFSKQNNAQYLEVKEFVKALYEFMVDREESLLSRKRDAASLECKAKAVEHYKDMLQQWKKRFIDSFYKIPSHLGAEQIEGIILENRLNGIKIKVVDMDGFGAVRAEEWAGSDAMKNQRKQLFKTLVEQVFNGADILINTDKQEQKVLEVAEGLDSVSEASILDIISQDAMKESGYTIENIIKKSKEAFEFYLEQLLTINPTGLSINAVKNEVKNVCNILVTLDSGYVGTIRLTLLEYTLGYKRYEELKNKFCK